jgi:hypothetical protein
MKIRKITAVKSDSNKAMIVSKKSSIQLNDPESVVEFEPCERVR